MTANLALKEAAIDETVIVLDDDLLVRSAMESLFSSVGYQTRAYGSPLALLEAGLPDGVRCLVLDMRMPGISGFDLQQRLLDRGEQVPIIFVTGHGDIPMGVRAMKSGAIDFLVKPFRELDILEAVSTALGRDRDRQARDRESGDTQRRYAALTPREREVMSHVVAGRLNKQIAGDLNLSEVTVKLHRGTMMRKMGVRTVPDLVRMAAALKASGRP